ncbi:MAG TPA: hypothetical protein VHG89_10195 [Verrucomicrobiae bacterium]|nr:hypothetical protein [Verrucomicrobiae bacterium]
MLSRLAKILLNFHILKKTARLSVPEQLRYLQLCRRVHGAMIPFCAIFAVASVFIAICAFVPSFAVMVHLDSPETEGVSDVFAFGLFLSVAVFSGVLFAVLFVTREMLAFYWLLIFTSRLFVIDCVPHITPKLTN